MDTDLWVFIGLSHTTLRNCRRPDSRLVGECGKPTVDTIYGTCLRMICPRRALAHIQFQRKIGQYSAVIWSEDILIISKCTQNFQFQMHKRRTKWKPQTFIVVAAIEFRQLSSCGIHHQHHTQYFIAAMRLGDKANIYKSENCFHSFSLSTSGSLC